MANEAYQTNDSAPSSSRGRSKVWNDFVVSEDRKKVTCRLCGDSLAYAVSQSTSSMLKHLTKKHNSESSYSSVDNDGYQSQADPKAGGTPKKKNTRVERIYEMAETEERELSPEPLPTLPGRVLFSEPCVKMRWTDHKDAFLGAFTKLFYDERYTDVTLVAEKVFFKAHRVILSSASDFFDEMFQSTPDGQHPILYLKNTKATDLKILLDFIYKGEVTVPPSAIKDLVQIGIEMKVRGLCDFNWNESEKNPLDETYNQVQNQSESRQNFQSEYNDSRQNEEPEQTRSFNSSQTTSFSQLFDLPEKNSNISEAINVESASQLMTSAKKRKYTQPTQSVNAHIGVKKRDAAAFRSNSRDGTCSTSISPVKSYRILTMNSASQNTRMVHTPFNTSSHLDEENFMDIARKVSSPHPTMRTTSGTHPVVTPLEEQEVEKIQFPVRTKIERVDHHGTDLSESHISLVPQADSASGLHEVVYSISNITCPYEEPLLASSQHGSQSNPHTIIMYDAEEAT